MNSLLLHYCNHYYLDYPFLFIREGVQTTADSVNNQKDQKQELANKDAKTHLQVLAESMFDSDAKKSKHWSEMRFTDMNMKSKVWRMYIITLSIYTLVTSTSIMHMMHAFNYGVILLIYIYFHVI